MKLTNDKKCLEIINLNFYYFTFKGIPQPGNLTKIKLTFSFCSDHLNNPEVDRTRRHVWSPVLINHTTVREAEEGQRREAGEWGNKLCWETNKCTVKEENNKMSHKSVTGISKSAS